MLTCVGVSRSFLPCVNPQLQNQSELRAPTAEKAAFFLDAAIASRRSSQRDCDEEDHRNSHMLFTLHIYQYRMEKSGKGGSKLLFAPFGFICACLETGFKQAFKQYSLVVKISRALHSEWGGAIHTSRLSTYLLKAHQRPLKATGDYYH